MWSCQHLEHNAHVQTEAPARSTSYFGATIEGKKFSTVHQHTPTVSNIAEIKTLLLAQLGLLNEQSAQKALITAMVAEATGD